MLRRVIGIVSADLHEGTDRCQIRNAPKSEFERRTPRRFIYTVLLMPDKRQTGRYHGHGYQQHIRAEAVGLQIAGGTDYRGNEPNL